MLNRQKLNIEETNELFEFLQGNVPEGYQIPSEKIPKLTADQAWIAVWYLGNLYKQVSDEIGRCDVCGCLYDSNIEGGCLDYGDPPYHFCDSCEWNSTEHSDKLTKKKCPDEFHRSPVCGEDCPTCLNTHSED